MPIVEVILKERELSKLAKEVDSYIIKIVKRVEELNSINGIPEVKVGTRHFGDSHDVLKEIGYCDKWGIVKFEIPLNSLSKWGWFWNPNKQLAHKYFWDWGDKGVDSSNKRASVEMYTNLKDNLHTLHKEM